MEEGIESDHCNNFSSSLSLIGIAFLERFGNIKISILNLQVISNGWSAHMGVLRNDDQPQQPMLSQVQIMTERLPFPLRHSTAEAISPV